MALLNPDDPTIPVGCNAIVLPTGVAADPNCYQQQNLFGPGRNLYWSKTPFSATPTAISIATKLAPTTSGGTTVPADMIGPIVGEFTYTGGETSTARNNSRDVPIPGDVAWTVKITDLILGANGTLEMARQSQKGGLPGHFYVVDLNNNWHGGLNGISEGSGLLTLRLKMPTGENDFQSLEGAIKGRGFFDAPVMASPVPVVY